MKKYFIDNILNIKNTEILQSEIARYRVSLIAEMKKQGATDDELKLVGDATIRNSIRSNRKPEDVAWAILQ